MKTRAPLFGVLAAVVMALGFYFLVWSPKTDEQAALAAETDGLEQQIASLETEVTRLEEIQANEFEYQAKLARLDEYIPDDPAQPLALKQFQQAADLAGVEITELTNGTPVLVEDAPPAEDPNLALAKIDVSMTAKGGYFQHVDLLRRLEVDVPRALLIRSVTVAEGEDTFPELATTWTGEMFTVVPIETAAPAGTDTTAEGEAAPEGDAPAQGDAAADQPAQAPTESTEATS